MEYSGRLDAEYYRKKFLHFESMVKRNGYWELGEKCSFLIGPFGSSFDTENYVKNGDYRYVRGQDVKPFVLQDSEKRYLPKEDFERLARYALRPGDLLVSVVGTLGNACIVQEKDTPAIFSCKSSVIRTNEINPVYILTFLNSVYGRELLVRKERGAIQKGLNLDDLKVTIIPAASTGLQLLIEKVFYKAQHLMDNSKKQYFQAEDILLNELKASRVEQASNPKKTVVAVKKFNESFVVTGRIDAEYYQPKFDEIIALIKSKPYKTLDELAYIKKSIEPGSEAYKTKGIPFYRVSDVSKFEMLEPDIYLDSTTYDVESLKPLKNTILFSKDGSIGIAYKVEESINIITSSALLHLKVKTDEILPDYLTLVLNSITTQMQAERDAGGSIIQHWRVEEIKNVLVPILSSEKQMEITQNVQKSFKLRKKSKELLETAKIAVEIAIEFSEEKALKYLNEKLV